jgi:hypothetical protein
LEKNFTEREKDRFGKKPGFLNKTNWVGLNLPLNPKKPKITQGYSKNYSRTGLYEFYLKKTHLNPL